MVTTPTLPRPLPVLNDLMKGMRFSWGSSHKTRSPIQVFNAWSTLDMEPEIGYFSMPPLEESVTAHLCPSLTMDMLRQSCANLLCELEENATQETYVELRKATDFCLSMAKGVAQNVGWVMGFSVVIHWHLWKNWLLDPPVKTLGLFGPVMDSITHKFEQQQRESGVLSNLLKNTTPVLHGPKTEYPWLQRDLHRRLTVG
eukprot:superscaffoldBa00006757_g21860